MMQSTALAIAGLILPSSGLAAGSNDAPPSAAPMTQLRRAIADARRALDFDGRRFSGPAFEWLVGKGREAQAFLVGEEHGIAENPKLAAALFRSLVPAGYRRIAVETSPPMASVMNAALLQGGLSSLEQLVTTPGSQVAFFGMREEAEWLAGARARVPRTTPLLWGLDYELTSDRFLIKTLKSLPKPAAATRALAALESASAASWRQYSDTHDPRFIFSFAGDPALVANVRGAWPGADTGTNVILTTLEETFAINRSWSEGNGYGSNLRRSQLMRTNLLRYWRELERRDPQARLFIKLGASHVIRGLSFTGVFDVGTMVPELAAARGGTAFHLLVLPGAGSETATFDPTRFRYFPGHRNEYGKSMELFHAATSPDTFTIFDTAPLRPIAKTDDGDLDPTLLKVIHGFDGVLVMTGSRPSADLLL